MKNGVTSGIPDTPTTYFNIFSAGYNKPSESSFILDIIMLINYIVVPIKIT